MFDFLAYEFMQRALLTACLVGGICSWLGVFVVLRGLAFIGAGTAHAAFSGVALAYLVHLPPLLVAIAFGVVTAWAAGFLEEKGRMKLDVSIGILFTSTMALAILFIGLMKAYNAEVYGYLFGSILSVTPAEMTLIVILSIAIGATLLAFSKELYFIAFDQEMAEASGIPARPIFFLLLTLIAVTVVLSLKAIGAVLVFAMLLIPASTAYQLTHSLRRMTWISIAIGIATSLAGVLLSYWFDLPSGPTTVLFQTVLFFVALVMPQPHTPRPGPPDETMPHSTSRTSFGCHLDTK